MRVCESRIVGPMLVVLCLSTFCVGCPARYRVPGDALKTPEEVLRTAASRVSNVKSMVMETRASVYADGRARKGTVEIALSRPSSLFFAVLSPTGDMLSVLASDGQRFTTFERGGKGCVTGCSTPENIGRIIPLVLEGRDAVDVLLGLVPFRPSDSLSMTWSETEGTYVVHGQGSSGRLQRVWVEHKTGIIRRAEISGPSRAAMTIDYDDIRVVAGTRIPHRLRIRMAKGDTDLQLDYRDVSINTKTVTPGTFRLDCPAGTNVNNLGCKRERE